MNKLIAEFIGTFALSFIGIASICNSASLVGVALAHGLTLCVMVSALGHISGGHFNPAVSFSLLVSGKISLPETVKYWVAQIAGSIAAAFLITKIFPTDAWMAAKLGTPLLAANINAVTGVLMESIMTAFLVFAVFGTAVDERAPKLGGLLIGLSVTCDILAGGPITGASMNPARSFGPALVGGFMENHLVYWVGPLLGATIAGLLYSKAIQK